jgi:hypothetical protein
MTRLIPQHISQLAFISATIMPVCSIFSYQYGHHSCMVLQNCVYVTTVLYWNDIDYSRTIRKIDICVTTCYSIYCGYIIIKYFDTFTMMVCLFSEVVCLSMYKVNEYIQYYQILNPSENIMNDAYSYFSLKYTLPNSLQREKSYYYLVCVHCFFLHIMTFATFLFGLIVNKNNYIVSNVCNGEK